MKLYAIWDKQTDTLATDERGDPLIDHERSEAAYLVDRWNRGEGSRYEIRVADVEWRREDRNA